MMRKPKQVMRRVNAPAWISQDGGFGVLRCTVVKLSDSEAELHVTDGRKLPDKFQLNLKLGDRHGRHCIVTWRTSSGIGVRFAA